jgi:hypothetical protein
MSRADAGALHDPLVGAFHPIGGQLGDQVGVAQAVRRQMAASADDAGVSIHVLDVEAVWGLVGAALP